MPEVKNQMVDLDNLEMFSEVASIDPEANFSDMPSLPPEFDAAGNKIKYMVVPRFVLTEDGKYLKRQPPKNKPDAPMSECNIQVNAEYVIEDEGMPWHHTRVRAWPSTRVTNAGTSEIDSILKAYTGTPGIGLTNGQKAKSLCEKIAAGIPFRITLRWEATEVATQEERDAGEFKNPFLRGMKNFPTRVLPDGSVSYDELDVNPATKKQARTQVRVEAYWPL